MSKEKKITTHSFRIDDAQKHGVNKAIILHNLRFWLERAKANESHIHDGHYWIYNTSKAFGALFPYFSESSIARWLRELEKDEVVLSNNKLNKVGFDHTKWYTIKDEYRISENETTDCDKLTDRTLENDSAIPDSKPDSKPDKDKNIKKTFKTWSEEELKQSIRELRLPEYTNYMLIEFFNYWSEKTPNGKKMLFQTKPSWETDKRMAFWYRNAYGNKQSKAPNPPGQSGTIHNEQNKGYSTSDFDSEGNYTEQPELGL